MTSIRNPKRPGDVSAAMQPQTLSAPPPEAVPLRDTREVADATDTTRSFTDFYAASWDQVARGLAATLGDRSLATEATDEAMARAYERWDRISAYDFPTGWVYRVGLNWARSYHRRLARAFPLRRVEVAELGAITDPSVRDALLDLSIRHRSVVVCRILLDWSVDQTADALDIAPGTVKSRLARALTILESTLGHLR